MLLGCLVTMVSGWKERESIIKESEIDQGVDDFYGALLVVIVDRQSTIKARRSSFRCPVSTFHFVCPCHGVTSPQLPLSTSTIFQIQCHWTCFREKGANKREGFKGQLLLLTFAQGKRGWNGKIHKRIAGKPVV
jgi:hypothetical protein